MRNNIPIGYKKKADTQESKGNLEAFGNTSFFIF